MLFIYFMCSYFIGSIPFGLVITAFSGLGDIRKIGSGNIGATNVLRTGKKWLALLTLLLDIVKGFLPVYIASYLLSDSDPFVTECTAIACVLGHVFPLWLKGKGGKGVATALGVFAAINIKILLIAIVIWILLFLKFRYSSLASLGAMISALVASIFLYNSSPFMMFTFHFIALLVIFKHHANIKRLLNKTEPISRFSS